jgi:hypothetical protein
MSNRGSVLVGKYTLEVGAYPGSLAQFASTSTRTDRVRARRNAAALREALAQPDERLGLLEAFRTVERPWTRSEINRARIISYQLGALLDGLWRSTPGAQANGAHANGANGHGAHGNGLHGNGVPADGGGSGEAHAPAG